MRSKVDYIRVMLVNEQNITSVYWADNNSSSRYNFHNGWHTERIGHEFAAIPLVYTGCIFRNLYIYGRRCSTDSLLGNVLRHSLVKISLQVLLMLN